MARLPQPGGDSGNWGDILNDYLAQSHKADGSLKDNVVTAASLTPNSVNNAALAADTVSKVQLQPVLRTELDDKLTQDEMPSVITEYLSNNPIEKTVLEPAVQDSLDKADSAAQTSGADFSALTVQGQPVSRGPAPSVATVSVLNLNLVTPGASIGGVTMAVDERFLAVGQTDKRQNGYYLFKGAATPAVRPADMSTGSQITGSFTFVNRGSKAQSGWECINTGVITVGSTDIDFEQFIASPGVGAQDFPGYRPGFYYFCNSPGGASSSNTLGNGSMRVTPWAVTNELTLSRLFAEFTTAGDAASVFRIGIYADDGLGRPGDLVLDAGSISTGTGNAGTIATGGTPGVYEIPLTHILPSGIYWVGGVVQGVTTTQPTIRCVNGQTILAPVPITNSLPTAGLTVSGFQSGGHTGALGSFSGPGAVTSVPRIGFRAG